MKTLKRYAAYRRAGILFLQVCVFALSFAAGQTSGGQTTQPKPVPWITHAHDVQHTGVSSVAAQPLRRIHWQTPVDLHPQLNSGELLIHYGSPLVTESDTVIVPVKTGITDHFRVEAHKGTDGSLLWRQPSDYSVPFAGFTPSFGPVLSQGRLIMPAAGGSVLVRQHPNQAIGKLSRMVFFGMSNFQADRAVYTQNVKINTPITADAAGNLFFGFVVLGRTPIGLESGLARVTPNGVGSWISASFASGDFGISKVMNNCAPALSLDGRIIYVAVNSFDFGFGYLLALDSKTLRPINAVRLIDPASGFDATTADESSATPTVGPDGDVYFGVLESPFPSHNDRGWLLHFSGDLTQQKIPGSFGWDDTASIVDASLVSSYHGSSKYLLMSKYNNYANVGGNGVNKLAVLDPETGMPDPINGTTTVMSEVLTIKGVTRDPRFPSLPGAVREWCINAAAVDPIKKAVMVNSEDGKLYRWDLTTNMLNAVIRLTGGLGEAYTPTVIGMDGTVYAINDAALFAIGR